jgi:hypothetical protein
VTEPLPVIYNAAYPLEYFDVVVIDEVHRSICALWRQVVEYFDAFLVGLTATPSKQTLGFFNKNLVMEYDHERAVADGVNVDRPWTECCETGRVSGQPRASPAPETRPNRWTATSRTAGSGRQRSLPGWSTSRAGADTPSAGRRPQRSKELPTRT